MKQSVLANIKGFLKQYEGELNYLYPDTKGLPTTGTGNLIATPSEAMKFPWKLSNGSPASPQDIQNEYQSIKDHPERWPNGGGNYKKFATLFLDQSTLDKLFQQKLSQDESFIKSNIFQNWDSLPADAQMGIISMEWGLGSTLGAFEKFRQAIRAGNFEEAAAQSHITGWDKFFGSAKESRNDADKNLFLNAAEVVKSGANPEVLYYPGKISGANPSGIGTGGKIAFGIFGLGALIAWALSHRG